MKKVIGYFGLTLVAAVMLAAVLTYLAPHFKWRVDAVASGSMEPQIKTGSLVVTRPVEPDEIAVGDIITFKSASGGTMITHRVVGIGSGSLLQFITKGDANGEADPATVPARKVAGKITFSLPYMGYVTEFLKTPWGFATGMVLPAIIIIAMYVWSVWQTLARRQRVRDKDE